ncbi:MAG: CHASE3 domain-containing protein [Cyclobacteriaceae bacterium]|nr:CHASE3 domain-containing protein [Cyclobacteriaceae bacterium]
MKFYVKRRVLFGFSSSLLIIVFLGILSFYNTQSFIRTSKMVSRTNQVLYNIKQIQARIFTIESEARGFVLTNQATFIQDFVSQRDSIKSNFKKLVLLTSGNIRQQAKLSRLDTLIEQKIKFNEQVVSARNESFEKADLLIKTQVGKKITDNINSIVSAFEKAETDLLSQRIDETERSINQFNVSFNVLIVVIITLLFILFYAINSNLQARAEAEMSLEKASKEIYDLYDNAPCAYLSVDYNHQVVNINNTALAWLGYEREEVIGKLKVEDLIHLSDWSVYQPGFNRYVMQGSIDNVELEMKRKDGSRFPMLVSSTAIYDSEGRFIKGRTSGFDITARKLAEQKIVELNRDLESYTHSVSHDLRAPLRSILGFTKILEDEYASKLDAEGVRQIGIIKRNAKRMGQLIDDLLEFSRNNRKEMIVSNIDVYAIVQNIVNEQLELEKGREIEFIISPLNRAKGDINMLRLVWINLIGNAIKYTRRTPKAKIEIFDTVDSGRVTYTIRDNGVGFDMKYVGKLFGVFQRLHTTEDFEGTGVGLALVSRIISRHGGKITAQGSVNQGATFSFYID